MFRLFKYSLLLFLSGAANAQLAIYVIAGPDLPANCSVAQGQIWFKNTGGAGVAGLYQCGPSNNEWNYLGSSGGTTVNSVTGTSNEINCTPTTGSVICSVTNPITFPGAASFPSGATFGTTGTAGNIPFNDAQTPTPGITTLSSPTTANGTLLINGTPILTAGGSNWNGFGMWQLSVPVLSGYTWWNQGSAISTQGTNFASVDAPAASGVQWRIKDKACPSGFTAGTLDLYALIVPSGYQNASYSSGIEIDDGTEFVAAYVFTNGSSSTILTATWTSPTGSGSTVDSDSTAAPISVPVWWHVHDAAGELTFDYSFTGSGVPGTSGGWRRLTSANTGGLSAVTNCGFLVDANNSGFGASVDVLSYAFVASLTVQ
jgi:hypothetical protein